MGFSQENGYVLVSTDVIMDYFMNGINTQFGTSYTTESFVATNFYKYFYIIAQRVQLNETKSSEIFLKLQNYIDFINARISRPVNTNPGIVDRFLVQGYVASVKPIVEADAGKINICVQTDSEADDYATVKIAICTLISQITVAGAVTQGAESEAIVLSNGQSFDFKFHLPDELPIILRLTITTSENNLVTIDTPDEIKLKLLSNIASRYKLGRNFEPQTYFTTNDAPWAGSILLEYSFDDGDNWLSSIYDAAFDDLITFGLADITLVEN